MLAPASFNLEPCDIALADALRQHLGCTDTLAWVLARRGVTVEAARALLNDDPSAISSRLHDPSLLGDMAAGVERIRFAIEHGEQIVVHGDYDADGVCSTTLLVEGLEDLGARARAFLPDRFSNGYGLQLDQVERFAADGVRLLITVDCGITAVDAVARAHELDVDVIICDHHQPGDQLPDAILCSTRPSDYPFPELCATAVAGKLLVMLGGPSGPRQHELEAIATIADCMPLVDENRALVQRGLHALRTTTRPGLRALAEQCGVRPRDIDAEAIAFKLAPRINAAGRISQSERAYDLLRSDEADAPALAAALDAINEQRRVIEREICSAAIQQVEEWTQAARDARVYVVHGPGWHEGVVGIVASRLVERFGRPVIVISDGEPARGSGRSIDGVDLHAALHACDDLLIRWGGHAQAAGVTIDPTRIAELRERLAVWGAQHVHDELLIPRDRIDAIVPASELRYELVQELERLAPYGTGWPRPRLLALDASFDLMQAVGSDGSHLRATMKVAQERIAAIGFGMAPHMPDLADGRGVDVALRPSINRFRGVESLQVQLDRIYPIPNTRPAEVLTGWCAAGCVHPDGDRVSIEHLLERASGFVSCDIASSHPDQLPAIEPLLAGERSVDLRHRALGVDHVAQLLAAGARTLVVVADAARRRHAFVGLADPERIGVRRALLASEHYSSHALLAALHRIETTADDGGALLVVSDHASLGPVLDAAPPFDVIVVADPPATDAARDQLAAAARHTLMHLVFGAAETRFTADVVRAAHDVRATLADTYRHLRDVGPACGSDLETLIYPGTGTCSMPRSPAAIVHGLQTLFGRGILERDSQSGLRLPSAGELHRATPAS